jgi:hypothetical protein
MIFQNTTCGRRNQLRLMDYVTANMFYIGPSNPLWVDTCHEPMAPLFLDVG